MINDKNLNNADIYLYEELSKYKISYADEFLLNICERRDNFFSSNNFQIDNPVAVLNTSPENNNSPIKSCFFNNNYFVDSIENIIEKATLNDKKKFPTPEVENYTVDCKTVSLKCLNDDIIKYKYLYYTDNAYIIPKHISKLLEVLYDKR